MNWNPLDDFLCHSFRFCYGIVMSFFILLIWISYLFWIEPINKQYEIESINYDYLLMEDTLLEQKIALYPAQQSLEGELQALLKDENEQQLLAKYDLERIYKWLLVSSLNLFDFGYQKKKEHIVWQFKLHGNYHDFVTFFKALTEYNIGIDICNILIYKQKNNIEFSLCFLSDNNPED